MEYLSLCLGSSGFGGGEMGGSKRDNQVQLMFGLVDPIVVLILVSRPANIAFYCPCWAQVYSSTTVYIMILRANFWEAQRQYRVCLFVNDRDILEV